VPRGQIATKDKGPVYATSAVRPYELDLVGHLGDGDLPRECSGTSCSHPTHPGHGSSSEEVRRTTGLPRLIRLGRERQDIEAASAACDHSLAQHAIDHRTFKAPPPKVSAARTATSGQHALAEVRSIQVRGSSHVGDRDATDSHAMGPRSRVWTRAVG
jgi:hypothetical protein